MMPGHESGILPGWDCHTHVFDGRPVAPGGGYEPPARSLVALEREARALGVGRVVLVQPSVYGTDNSVLLAALQANPGIHRGVAVLDDTVSDRTIREMDEAGVRGVRFNLVSPAGNSTDALERLAPRLRDHDWHVQWYAPPRALVTIAQWHERLRLRCVLDHVAGFTRALAADTHVWSDLQRLAGMGAWIKLSGWYRLAARAPYDDLDAVIARVATLFGEHCVWGSDWPHTKFLEPGCEMPMPSYEQTWQPVPRALGLEKALRVLRDYPRVLYA